MKRLLRAFLMICIAGAILVPFLWTLATSLKPLSEVNRVPPEWFSPNMSFSPYVDMFFYLPFATYAVNSLIVATSATAITLVLGSLAGFAFSRFAFPGKIWLLVLLLLSQMLPGASVIIPLFQLMREAHLYGSTFGLILVHTALLLPFAIWLLYGFFNSIPREVEDAALIDGCSRLSALRRVILPLALPGLGATALFAFLGSWNEFFFALILTNMDATHTVPVGIGVFVGEFNDVWNQMSAAAVLFSVPPMVVYLLMRKTFIKGLAAGAIK